MNSMIKNAQHTKFNTPVLYELGKAEEGCRHTYDELQFNSGGSSCATCLVTKHLATCLI